MTGSRSAAFRVLAMAALLPAAFLTSAMAAETPTVTPVALVEEEEELEELDEVLVQGERLMDVIVKAEDEFYKIYNQVNKDDKYDVNCPRLNVSQDSGSRIQSRLCMPVFVADAIANFVAYQVQCEPKFSQFDSNKDGRVSRMESMVNTDLNFQFDELDQNDDDQLDEYGEFRAFETWALMNLNCYRPPEPDLVLMEGTDKWYKHMMKVTNEDPRLRDMAGRLDELHQELTSVQRRYRSALDARQALAPDRTPDRRNSGPR